jgi:protein SCO1/2
MRIAALTIAAILTTATLAAAQGSMRVDRSLPSNQAPEVLKKVTIDGHLNAQIPLDLPFRDESGATVRLGSLLHEKRPAVLIPAYYECPMLCTQVLNSLFTALGVIKLDPGKDFDVITVSFDPKEPAGLARDKKAAYLKKYDRPGTEGGFHFLTGDESSIAPLMDTIGFRYQYDPAIDQYAHPAMIAVLTPDGRISKYFLGIDYSARDLRFALIEASEGHVGSVFERKVITWCYNYDPTTGKYGLLTMRLVQGAGIAFIVTMLVFWSVMWRRERATAAA